MDIIWRYGERKISLIISFKHLFRVHVWSVTVFPIARWVNEPQYSVAEAPIIRVLNVDDGPFGFKVWWKLAVTPTREWDVPHSAEYELKNARKHKSGLFADKGGV